MSAVASISSVTSAITSLSNLLLVSPQNTIGYQPNSILRLQKPPSLVFHYEGEQTATIESDITDHFVEDNTAIQDQIALKPETITTQGFIGELNDVVPSILQPVYTAADKLTVVSAYTPALSATALLAYNEAFQAYQILDNARNTAISAYSSLTGQGGENVIGSSGILGAAFDVVTGEVGNNQNKQQVYFQQFYGYWKSRTLFTVQTPWAVFENMAILSLRAIQDADTRVITDFEITFKMMRFSSLNLTSATPISIYIAEDRFKNAASTSLNLGSSVGQGPPISLQSKVD